MFVRSGILPAVPLLLASLVFAVPGVKARAQTTQSSEETELRERLTEREDKRRPLDPYTIRIGGHSLTLGGEAETVMSGTHLQVLGRPARERDRVFFEGGLDVEAFYTLGPEFSVFAQLQMVAEQDLLSGTLGDVSDAFVERGEMWIYTEGFADSPFELDVGRLDYDDERTFWWDDELDSVRGALEFEKFGVGLALAHEVAPARLGRGHIDSEHDGITRIIGELDWDWQENHSLELFLLHQSDHSRTQRIGETIPAGREDESDARLTWIGLRAMGGIELGGGSLLGYWLDAAGVRGRESLVEFEPISRKQLEAVSRQDRDVGGWALDLGAVWVLPGRFEPRFFAGFAMGSGDSSPESGSDRSFRQTGLQSNESGFGGVERFASYGILLDPELSNLQVFTLGIGFSLLRSSSLDVAFHHYQQAHEATFVRDSPLDIELTGRSRQLGQALDVVLALEEWERFEILLTGSALRTGSAFGSDAGRFVLGASLALRLAF